MAGADDLILPDGEGAAVLGEAAIDAKITAAKRAGILCSACGEPLDGDAWQYVSFRTEFREGEPSVISAVAYICARDTCAEPRSLLEKSAAARRPWPAWHIFEGEPPPEEPPAAEEPQT